MANNYITFEEKDLGGGLDQQSAENQIPQGYVEDVENMTPLSTGQMITRPGYQGYLGYVPIRIKRVEYTDDASDNLCLFLDGSISLQTVDLSSVASTPLLVKGKTSSANSNNAGDFPNDAEALKYYSGFTVDVKKTLSTGTNTLTITADEHGLETPYIFVQVLESTSLVNNSNRLVMVDSVEINSSTYQIDITYTNGTGSDIEAFVLLADKSAETGTTFVSSATSIATGTNTYTITAATHGLNNFNIIPKVYEDTGTELIELTPDDLTVDNTGDVEITFTNGTGSAFDARFVLTATAASDIVTGSAAPNSTLSITIPNLTDNFLFVAPYLEVTPGGDLEYVIPDNIEVDAEAGEATVTFQNNTSSGKNFEIYYEASPILANKLCVDASVIGGGDTFTDLEPQLTMWGIPHTELYGPDRQPRAGWVNHIDSYRSSGEDRLICGLGGNLFSAQLSSEGTNATDLLMDTFYPDIRGRLDGDTILGPVFYDTTDSPSRTRGYIQADSAGNGFVTISEARYQSSTGYMRYRLQLPGKVISGTLSTIIAADDDTLTVQQMGYSRLNGTFTIKAVTEGADYIDVDVENSQINSVDYDESDAGGLGGIFSDQFDLLANSKFLVGDTLSSGLFSNLTVTKSTGTKVVVNGLDEQVSLPSGLRMVGSRTTDTIPLRDIDGTATVENLVRGDMLTYTGLTRKLRVKYIRTEASESVTVAGDGATATVTLSSSLPLAVGQTILLTGDTDYAGSHTITGKPSSTTVTFASSLTASESATLVGKTVSLDENLTIADSLGSSNLFTVEGRWIPIEAPEDNFDLTPSTYTTHFDSRGYSDQNILRSVMVQDSLYFTNASDEVMKFDGTNLYRAGLFRWQPHLYVSTDTGATGKIVLNNPNISYTASATNRFTVALEDRLTFQIGDRIRDSIDDEDYIVTDTLEDGTDAYIVVDREIQSSFAGTPTLTKVSTLRYYFRLNAVDANNNIIASAVTGADDFLVTLAEDAAVYIKLVGMPALDNYDYDRLEVQIYRTQSNQVAPFYRLTTLPMSFNSDDGYLTYTDTDSDEDLRDLDEVNTALYGAELGTTMREPLRASYCTSADNRLVLSNIRDYPSIDLRLIQNGSGPITQADLTASGNARYLFRKDNTDTATTTDMVNRAAYEFVSTSGEVTITPNTDIAGSAGVLTITSTGHGLSAGDWVYFYHSAVADGKDVTFSGHYQVASAPTADTFTINTDAARNGTADDVDRYVTATAPADIPVLIGTDGNYGMFNGNRDATSPYEFVAIRRMANAINTSMRKVDITISGYEDFRPWMIGNAGNEFNVGQLIVRQPKVEDTFLEVLLPTLTGVFDVFVNNVKREADGQAGALTRLFPSRTLISFPNFPEIFDSPTVQLDADSLSAVDVNSADGQEITACIPFFGESAFGGAQQSGIVVIFKENSIYLLDTAAKAQGAQSIQKIESEGKGCTAPFSVAVTKAGIMFANFAGIYRLNRNLTIDYIGRKYERIWKEEVNRNALEIATGHHFANGNLYKLSVPVGTSQEENNEVAVYNHTREYEGKGPGSWATYTNHAATGWANLQDDAYFASTDGQVFSIRRANNLTDYRDDDQAIPFRVLMRALDFGDAGIRKVFGWIISHYRTLVSTSSIRLRAGVNLADELSDTDDFNISKSVPNTGLSDEIGKKVVSIKSSLRDRTGSYLQLEYSGSVKDEPLELAGVSIRVAGKSSKGIGEAAES